MRFVVPLPGVCARPNPRFFGRRGGATGLNMINDQAAGPGGKVVATPRDSLYVLDVLHDHDGGSRPEMVVTDTASHSVMWTVQVDHPSACCEGAATVGPVRRVSVGFAWMAPCRCMK